MAISKIGSGSDGGKIGGPNSQTDEQEAATGDGPGPTSPGEPPASETVDDVLAEIDALVGLEEAKQQVRRLVAVHQANRVRQQGGHTAVPVGLHLAFLGPPGTGKTTLARLVARVYRALGLLPKGQLVEADRSSLVAGYVGQTALKVKEVVRSADGGVLFIDEAYALASDAGAEHGYGDEAIAALINEMENRRGSMAVILAGYEDGITRLLESNEGMKSRIQRSLIFTDYSSDQLLEIFDHLCTEHDVGLTTDVRSAVVNHLQSAGTAGDGGNARYVRNLFESMFTQMSYRASLDGTVDIAEVTAFAVDDVPAAASDGKEFGFLAR